MYRQYFLTCCKFHQPRFELALQRHYISLPETLIKGLRKLLSTCQRHSTGIAVGSLLSFLTHFVGARQLPAHCTHAHWLGSGSPGK